MNQPKRTLLIFFLILSIAVSFYLFFGNKSRVVVSLSVDGVERRVETKAHRVEDLLRDENISVEEGDFLHPLGETSLQDDMRITFEKAKTVTLIDGGNKKVVKTLAKTVKELLQEEKVSYDSDDKISHSPDAPITGSMVLKVDHYLRKVVMVEEPIDFSTIRKEASHLKVGEEKVLQAGVKGVNQVTYEEIYVNQQLTQTLNLKTRVKNLPIDQIIGFGRDEEVLASRGEKQDKEEDSKEKEEVNEEKEEPTPSKPVESEEEKPKTPTEEESEPAEETKPKETEQPVSSEETPKGEGIVMEATAYAIQGTTASGVPSGPGKVAVDPSVIPLGTKLYIESLDDWPDYGYAIAADTGGAIVGNRIDLFFSDEDTCYKFGRRNVKVTIVH